MDKIGIKSGKSINGFDTAKLCVSLDEFQGVDFEKPGQFLKFEKYVFDILNEFDTKKVCSVKPFVVEGEKKFIFSFNKCPVTDGDIHYRVISPVLENLIKLRKIYGYGEKSEDFLALRNSVYSMLDRIFGSPQVLLCSTDTDFLKGNKEGDFTKLLDYLDRKSDNGGIDEIFEKALEMAKSGFNNTRDSATGGSTIQLFAKIVYNTVTSITARTFVLSPFLNSQFAKFLENGSCTNIERVVELHEKISEFFDKGVFKHDIVDSLIFDFKTIILKWSKNNTCGGSVSRVKFLKTLLGEYFFRKLEASISNMKNS